MDDLVKKIAGMSNSFWYTGQILRKSYPKFLRGGLKIEF